MRIEALKRELEEMGMFAPEYKKPIPRYAMRVGVVTARTGAAIQDIRNISARRNPYVQLILYPAQVQGDGAVPSIIQGIQALDAMHLDVLIVGRGGGSIEDLWAFNEEAVARAVFDCETPVISAVGHETDTTIVDYVADLRAPTPSAAAELAVFDLEGFYAEIAGRKQMLQKGMQRHFDRAVARYEQNRMRLAYLSPENQLNQKKQYLADLQERINHKMQELIQKNRTRLLVCAGKLDGLSPLKRLGQGYSVVTDASGHTVTSIGQVQVQDRLQIHVVDGTIEAQVEQTRDQREK